MKKITLIIFLIIRIELLAVTINEIMINPVYNQINQENYSCNEFIELYNKLDYPIDLKDWYLTDLNKDQNDILTEYTGELKIGTKGTVLLPKSYALVVPSNYKGRYNPLIKRYSNLSTLIMLTIQDTRFTDYGLNNNKGSICLYTPLKIPVSSFSWEKDPGIGVTWEKIYPYSEKADNWIKNFNKGSPGYKNSIEINNLNSHSRLKISDKILNTDSLDNFGFKIIIKLNHNEICSLKIYNLNGIRKKTIIKNYSHYGSTIFYWNGNDDKGNKLQTGIYLILLVVKYDKKTKIFKKPLIII